MTGDLTVTTLTMRDKAVQLAKQGFKVFPLRPGTKLPAVTRFYEVASSDPETVATMWTTKNGESTHHNIGISTDDLLVFDIDNKNGHDAQASLRFLVEKHGLSTDTPTCITPTGGLHLFYRLPPGVQVANTCGKIAPGIDTRGYHGFVVGPGSVVRGTGYEWVSSTGEH